MIDEKGKYFSDDDWSIGRALERAEKMLVEYESGAQCSDMNSNRLNRGEADGT